MVAIINVTVIVCGLVGTVSADLVPPDHVRKMSTNFVQVVLALLDRPFVIFTNTSDGFGKVRMQSRQGSCDRLPFTTDEHLNGHRPELSSHM